MLRRSFAEFHAQQALLDQQMQLLKREGELSKMNDCMLSGPTIEEYYEMAMEAEKLGEHIQETVMHITCISIVTNPRNEPIVLLLNPNPSFTAPTTLVMNTKHETIGIDKLAKGYYRKANRGLEDEYSVSDSLQCKGFGVVNLTLPHYGKAAGTGYVVTEIGNKGFVSIRKNKLWVDHVRLLEDVSAATFLMKVHKLLELAKEHSKVVRLVDWAEGGYLTSDSPMPLGETPFREKKTCVLACLGLGVIHQRIIEVWSTLRTIVQSTFSAFLDGGVKSLEQCAYPMLG
eukprot:Gb_00004 [translate_table: standard]